MIPSTVRPMKEPLRTLVLEGIRSAGNCTPDDVLLYIEENLTPTESRDCENFLRWLTKNNLSVGHGTISLRWDEFRSKRAPASQDEAYQWAMKRAGV
jgi:hypothetical protein